MHVVTNPVDPGLLAKILLFFFFASLVSASVALPARRVKALRNIQVGKNERAAGRTASVAISHPGPSSHKCTQGRLKNNTFFFNSKTLDKALK